MTACTAAAVCKSTTVEIGSMLWYFYVLCVGQQEPSSTEDPLDQSSTISWTGVRADGVGNDDSADNGVDDNSNKQRVQTDDFWFFLKF